MDQRILIFSPELIDKEDIGVIVKEYFFNNFKKYFKDLKIQKFSSFREPLTYDQLGHWNEGEIFVVMDRRLCPKGKRLKSDNQNIKNYYRGLKITLDLSKKVCEEKDIPYVTYEGEMRKDKKPDFINKIDLVKSKIENRLECNLENFFIRQ